MGTAAWAPSPRSARKKSGCLPVRFSLFQLNGHDSAFKGNPVVLQVHLEKFFCSTMPTGIKDRKPGCLQTVIILVGPSVVHEASSSRLLESLDRPFYIVLRLRAGTVESLGQSGKR